MAPDADQQAHHDPLRSFIDSLTTPSILFSCITAAAVMAVLNVATAVSIGSLVFSGPLTPYASLGIGLFLIGTILTGFAISAMSGYKAIIAGPRGAQSPIFAALAGSIAVAMSGQTPEAIAVTVIAAILVTTFIVGSFMLLVGWTKMGAMARYIPFPVMGGFFAGLGYLLTKGALFVAAGPIADTSSVTSFFTPEVIAHLLPAIAFGVLLYVLEQRFNHWVLVPLVLGCAVGLFYLTLLATDTSVEEATQSGWLTAFAETSNSFFPVLKFDQLPLIDWTIIAQQAGTIVVFCILAVIMLLLDISGVEMIINRDLDPNKELRTAGLANMVGAFATSPLSSGGAADTTVTHKLGGDRFLMVVFYTLLMACMLVVGPTPIEFVPPVIVGGFLLYIGISFLIEWVWKKLFTLPLADVLVIVIILMVVAFFGLLEGVGAGILLATILFVHKYSQLSVIRSTVSGAEHVSNIDRHQDDQDYLDQHGHRTQIFVLQGFLFFGSASGLLERIKLFVNQDPAKKPHYLVADFMRVDGIDSSAVNSFAKLMQICEREGIVLCLSGNQRAILERLQGLGQELGLADGVLQVFNDLDTAVGWCDDQQLLNIDTGRPVDLTKYPDELLGSLIKDESAVYIISKYFDTVSIAAGETLFEQGQSGDALYLILNGSISITIDLPDGQSLTVRTMRSGSILGEMAVYTGAPRSATAKARKDSVLFRLSTESYDQLVVDQPAAAGVFSSYVVRLMAERVSRANRAMLALSK